MLSRLKTTLIVYNDQPTHLQENEALEVIKRAFEKARAVFYANASDPTLKMRMHQRESELLEVTIDVADSLTVG